MTLKKADLPSAPTGRPGTHPPTPPRSPTSPRSLGTTPARASSFYTLAGYSQPYGSAGFCSSATGEANFLVTSSGSGGPSNYSAQPSWQVGVPGLPTASGGKRYLPDVSLFAANGAWGHFYVYCMSDAAQGGVACNYSNTTDTLGLAAGGTSFAAPAMAGIQALVNQKTGSRQGNPNYKYYGLAATQVAREVACDSDQGAPGSPSLPSSACVFHDVTQGDIDVPCTGTVNCFGASKKTATYGALSSTSGSYTTAYAAGTGWDYATGLGSLNAYNLVTSWDEGSADAGTDGGAETGANPGGDAGSDATLDAGTDAGADATVDATVDAVAEAGIDADTESGVDAAPQCTCSGIGLAGPVTVSCGQTTCGQDDNTYLCSTTGWAFNAAGCGGNTSVDAAASCSCSGVGSAGPVTVTCGQTTCGQDSNTYLCSGSGWSFDVSGCSGGRSRMPRRAVHARAWEAPGP